MGEISWGKRLMPLIVIQAYLGITVYLYAAGPWQWPMRQPERFYGFVIALQLAFGIGYLAVAHRAPRACSSTKPVQTWAWTFAFANLFLLPLTSYARTGRWVPDIMGGLRDPGKAYEEAQLFAMGGTNAAGYARIFASPLMMALVPILVFYWRRLDSRVRTFGLMAVAGNVVMMIAAGQRRDIADTLVMLPFLAVAAHWAGITVMKRTTQISLSIAAVGAMVAFLSFFAHSHLSRVGSSAAQGFNPATLAAPDVDNKLVQAVPEELRPASLGFLNYITTGYYGLSLALDREYKPMYGFGHSMFLTRNAMKILPIPSYESRSLPVQISNKDGFRYPVLWCTAYPYFMNDLGDIGTIVLMALFGALFALTWIDSLGGKNVFAVAMFGLMTILLFYLPATNRMLQDGEGVMAFYGWLVLWLANRQRVAKPVAATQTLTLAENS